jgi:hypothetical protein
MDHVPFVIDEVYGGFAQTTGVARIERDGLGLEFETADGLFGIFRSGIRDLVVPWSEVALVECKVPRFGGLTLTLRTRGLAALAPLPGRNGNEVKLSVAREHRAAAEDFTARAQLRMVQGGLADIEGRLRSLQAS